MPKTTPDGETQVGVFANLRHLINIVDELRDVGVQQYINLPRICVVGTQSAGKSSVLEGIVGMDFLPRGEGIVTRRPLELRLIHSAKSEDKNAGAWAVFDTDKVKMSDFEAVRRKIDVLTDQVAGKNKNVVDNPIVLTICGPNCPDLTLVDLPGITRVPLKGSDQTDDIERVTRDMATRYARDPRTIILAVIPANQDISTSDALQLARKVDPHGLRTIGVVTKLDLMDRGTNAARMIAGDEVPLRLGYVAVKNRSQQDINARLSIADAIDAETEFFKSHTVYKSLPSHYFGMRSLIDKLTMVLFRHIKEFLPEIKNEISLKLRSLKQRIAELGEGVPTDPQQKTQLMWTMISDFCELYRNTIRGKYDKRLSLYLDSEPQSGCGGAHIRGIFNNLLKELAAESSTNAMSDAEIDAAIRMHEGDSLPGFPSPDTFEYLILPHLQKLHGPVTDCLDKVSQCLELLTHNLASRVFCRFPALASQILELSHQIQARERERTQDILESIVAAETGYLFTNDEDYLTNHGSMLPINRNEMTTTHIEAGQKSGGAPVDKSMIPQRGPGGNLPQYLSSAHGGAAPPSSLWFTGTQGSGAAKDSNATAFQANLWTAGAVTNNPPDKRRTQYSEKFLNEIRGRLNAYFNIVVRNIRDTVPKTIGFFLVRATEEALQFRIYNELNKAEHYDALLGEPSHVKEERVAIHRQIKVLKGATVVLQKDPNIAAIGSGDMFDESFDWELSQLLHQEKLQHETEMRQQEMGRSTGTHSSHQQSSKPPSEAPTQSFPAASHSKLSDLASSYLGRTGLFEAKKGPTATTRAPLF